MAHLRTPSGTQVRHVDGNCFDVFFGSGWEDWSRVKTGRSYTHVIAGKRLTEEQIKEVHTTINGKKG
jgi:hypothetical protein